MKKNNPTLKFQTQTLQPMTTKLPWRKPGLKIFGSLEHVELRISSIQRRIAIYSNKLKLDPDNETKDSLEVYSEELTRLQKKYSIILKLNSHARARL